MATRGKAPRQVTWIVCLLLFLVAVLAHFQVIQVRADLADWAWIIGYALLLLAVQVRGL